MFGFYFKKDGICTIKKVVIHFYLYLKQCGFLMNIFITGSVGSGKSTFHRLLMKHLDNNLFSPIDLDKEAKKIIAEQNIEIPTDKTSLFLDQQHLFYIEKQVWKNFSIDNSKNNVIEASTFWECPLIFKKGDIIINVQSPNTKQQVLSRDSVDRAELINKNQISSQVKSIGAQYNINNNGSLEELEKQAKVFAENLNYQQTNAFKDELEFLYDEWHTNFPELPKTLFYKLISEYKRIDRFYHNTQHLKYLISHFKEIFKPHIKEKLWKRAIMIAIFYHDVKMKFSTETTNEEDSVRFLFDDFINFDIFHKSVIGTRSYVSLAADLIMATKNHNLNEYILSSEKGIYYGNIFLDLDLLILADKDKIFEYESQIRKEWQHIDDSTYKFHRKNILQSFLNKDKIFFSPEFEDKNQIAKELISKLIKSLD